MATNTATKPTPVTVGAALNAQLATGTPAPVVVAGPVATNPIAVQSAQDNAKEKAAKAAKRALRLPLQPNLKEAVTKAAAEAKKTPTIYIRDLLAEKFGIKIEATTTGGGKKKYASKDERKAASKERRIAKAELVKKLLAKHEAEAAAEAAKQAKA